MTEVDWTAFDDFESTAPGPIVAVVAHGRIDASAHFGTERPSGPPLTIKSRLYVASIAKQFTASVIASLILDRTLSLDDDVRRWIPEMTRHEPPIRLKHLLTHTSGLGSPNSQDEAAFGITATSAFTTADRVQYIVSLPIVAEPGTVHRYANEGYVLLAEVAARATGRPLGELAAERLFRPAGMTSTSFLDSSREPFVPGWSGGRCVDVAFTCVGDGGLISCVADLANWTKWLPSAPVAPLVLGARPTLPNGLLAHDSWGVSVRTHHGQRIESHGGAIDGYLGVFVRFPHLGTSVIALANSDADGATAFNARVRRFTDALLGDLLDVTQPSWAETHGLPAPA